MRELVVPANLHQGQNSELPNFLQSSTEEELLACLHGNKTQKDGKRNIDNKGRERKRMTMRITLELQREGA